MDAESQRLIEFYYQKFVHAGANLSEPDKAELKKMNEEESTLSNAFITKLLAATKDGAYRTTDPAALAGLSEAQMAAAAQAAKERKVEGWVLPLQNTTQQPDLVCVEQSRDAANAVRRFVESRRTRRRERYQGHYRTPGPASRRERQAAGLSKLRRLEAGGPDGEDA